MATSDSAIQTLADAGAPVVAGEAFAGEHDQEPCFISRRSSSSRAIGEDDEGDEEEDEPQRDERGGVEVAHRLGELVGDGGRDRRGRGQQRGLDLVGVADDEGHGHRLAQRAAKAEHHAADDADAGVGEDDVLNDLPASCSPGRRRSPSAWAAPSRTRRARSR